MSKQCAKRKAPVTEAKSANRFFEFHQNNSGGSWHGPKGLVVEAADHFEANTIAKQHGVYFDGVAAGYDCACCGDRWYPADAGDKGNISPTYYGEYLVDGSKEWYYPVKVVYKDGKERFYA
jgi:hypothetical protein